MTENNRVSLHSKIEKDVGSYLEWLESYTLDEDLDAEKRFSYRKLIRKLWSMPFHGSIGNDIDRVQDGLQLRSKYDAIVEKIIGVQVDYFDTAEWSANIYGECRVLEFLIALSIRMYELMEDTDLENSVSRWFWEIMGNVAFDILDDSVWEIYEGDRLVEQIVNRIMDLDDSVGLSGRGGWFYIYGWTELEIWYQMHVYLRKVF